MLSAVAGAFALEMLFTLLTVLGVASTWRDTVQGVIIIVAVAAAARAWQVGRRPRRGRSVSPPGGEVSPTPAAGNHELGATTTPAPGTNTGDK